MNKFRTYDDMIIEVIRSTTDPQKVVAYACQLTQKRTIGDAPPDSKTAKLIEYLMKANHTSPFEHPSITVLIESVSRSFLAQITRHRMGSFTSASQHYTTYDEFPNITSNTVKLDIAEEHFNKCDEVYKYLISVGIPKEEARQVLPNAKAVNILWTVNARSLINFFNQRLCLRNVEEMQIFAATMHKVCINWFPELFKDLVGPDCWILGGCRQGRMKAKECIDAEIPDFKT